MNGRVQDPVIGRFVSADPFRMASSRYSYVDDRPLSATDPSGYSPTGAGYRPPQAMDGHFNNPAYSTGRSSLPMGCFGDCVGSINKKQRHPVPIVVCSETFNGCDAAREARSNAAVVQTSASIQKKKTKESNKTLQADNSGTNQFGFLQVGDFNSETSDMFPEISEDDLFLTSEQAYEVFKQFSGGAFESGDFSTVDPGSLTVEQRMLAQQMLTHAAELSGGMGVIEGVLLGGGTRTVTSIIGTVSDRLTARALSVYLAIPNGGDIYWSLARQTWRNNSAVVYDAFFGTGIGRGI
jgi:hypothetical protein